VFCRILVGVDDTPASCRALKRAIEIAAESHGRLALLTSAPEPSHLISASPFVPPHNRLQLRGELEHWAQQCVEAATRTVPVEVPVTKLVTHGSPAAALLREARTGNWDLIVVGQTPKRFRLRRPLAERLLRRSPTPVLVVRGDSEPEFFDGRAHSRRRSRRRAVRLAARKI
jgi:nucleotide-binding universal stress UspA family protein